MGKTTKTVVAAVASKAPAVVAPADGVCKRRKKPNTTSYASYIYKVLKSVNSNVGISGKTMRVMDSFCNDMFQKICVEASRIARYNKKHTITAKTVQSACQIVLPGQIQKHAISEGTKAVVKYLAAE